MRPQNRFINQVQQQLFSTIYLFFLSSMDSVFQHGSSSGYIHDGPDFLIAQQHLQVVADLLASTTFAERAAQSGECGTMHLCVAGASGQMYKRAPR